jgi:hypothetical protein
MIPNATILDGNSRRYENRIVASITDQPRIVAELQASTRLPNADEPRTERMPKQTVLCLVVDCCVSSLIALLLTISLVSFMVVSVAWRYISSATMEKRRRLCEASYESVNFEFWPTEARLRLKMPLSGWTSKRTDSALWTVLCYVDNCISISADANKTMWRHSKKQISSSRTTDRRTRYVPRGRESRKLSFDDLLQKQKYVVKAGQYHT